MYVPSQTSSNVSLFLFFDGSGVLYCTYLMSETLSPMLNFFLGLHRMIQYAELGYSEYPDLVV